METLRAADRRVWGWSALVWLLASVVGAFWALPHVEDELDEESLGVESYTTTDGAVVRWNGRDGYLRVPEGTANAEAIAADLADITGTRDVEISYTASLPKPADLDPANFEVTWDPDGATGSGVVPDGLGDELNDLFATGDDLRPDASRSLGDDVVATLESVVAPIIGSALVSGTVNVAENEIAVTGVAPDAKAKAEIEAELSAAGVTHEITVPSPDPATFTVVWDRSGSEQTGDAPADLSDGLRALGVAAPLEGDNVTVGDNVAPTLAALAPLVGTDLISGTVSVDDAAVVITGTAPSQEALDRATAALAESGAAVDLELSGEAQAQTSIDSLLALGKIEFVSGTATPTPATQAVIDQVAAVLADFPNVTIAITGHTDAQGDDGANQALSEARATAIVDGLAARGIDRGRMSATGLGETVPIDTNDTAEGRQRNRRVEIEAKESN